jgi:hypothetical protein
VTELTSVGVAPVRSAFATGAVEEMHDHARVFETQRADRVHEAGMRLAGCAAPIARIAFGP